MGNDNSHWRYIVSSHRYSSKRYIVNEVRRNCDDSLTQYSNAIDFSINGPSFLLKYEAEKGRIALAAMIGGIVFVVIFFFKMFETAGIELIDIVMNQMYLKNITLWASIYIISIVIWFLSLKIAEGIMLKRILIY